MSIKHKFVSAVPDGPDSSLMRPSDWNAEHDLTETITAVSTNTGIALSYEVVACTAGAGGITLTLPSAVGIAGKSIEFFMVDTGPGNVVISSILSQTITGITGAFTTYTLMNQGQYVRLTSDGANWLVRRAN